MIPAPNLRRGCAARLVAGIIGAVTVVASAAPAVAVPAQQGTTPPTTAPGQRTKLAWKSCGDGLQCATLTVPVDDTQPRGAQVALALARRRANDQAHRIGSLVVNFGGPGDPGTQTLRQAAATFPKPILDRFDIVSFDPRGTGASRPIDCVDDATFEKLWSEDPTPNSLALLPKYYDGSYASVDFVKACIDTQGAWLTKVGTRAVAHDLEHIRAALGDPKLTYLGDSYGTAIGAVFAQLFPTRIRAMVLDGAVNLSATATQEQLGNVVGFEHSLDEFLAQCGTDTNCAFHSNGDPRAALTKLRDRFEGGLVLTSDDGRHVGVSEFYTTLLAALYQRSDWTLLARALHEATRGDGTLLRLVTDVYTGRGSTGMYNNFQEAIGIIDCDDRRDARPSFDVYRSTYERFKRQYPFFGPVLAAQPVGCDPRLPAVAPGDQLGDVHAEDAPPIVIVGTTQDPATPYAGALDLQQRLSGSRLVTFVGTEHGGYDKGNACIDAAVDAYFVTRALPPNGTRCN